MAASVLLSKGDVPEQLRRSSTPHDEDEPEEANPNLLQTQIAYSDKIQENANLLRRTAESIIASPSKEFRRDSLRDVHRSYLQIRIEGEAAIEEDDMEVAEMLVSCLELRKKWLWTKKTPYPTDVKPSLSAPFDPFNASKLPPAAPYSFRIGDEGVFQVFDSSSPQQQQQSLFPVGGLSQYYRDLNVILNCSAHGPCKTHCFRRLKLLEAKYNLHVLLNDTAEHAQQRAVPHRDFYNVRKVDTHVHHSSSMNQKHLLRFIRSKCEQEPNEPVIFRDGQLLTLSQVFESLKLTPADLTVDTLDVHADTRTFHRFDRFNLKYNPFGQSRLREIFLKTDNHIKGRYLAEITKQLFRNLEESKYQNAEYRLSIYGKNQLEWAKLAGWVLNNRLYSDNVRWLVQIPRMYSVYKEDEANFPPDFSFQHFIDNIFRPLFQVTVDPSSCPQLHLFLLQTVGVDCVDDESKLERRLPKYPPPAQWTMKHNPPYSYYVYYLYANLYVLNKLREQRGLNVLEFRPHSGEAGDPDHLASAFLLANNINHGVNLRKTPALQYLFYLAQIPIAMSPLSNNSLFLNYDRNPFPVFFARGLRVSLSTDDPLQFHYTREPLIEEYSIAQSIYKLSNADICEVALNSVLQSGFEHEVKSYWLGENYHLPGARGNDIMRTNVPNIRICFRETTLRDEWIFLRTCLYHSMQQKQQQKAKPTPTIKSTEVQQSLDRIKRQLQVLDGYMNYESKSETGEKT